MPFAAHPRRLDPRRAVSALAWVLVFAYSFAPFDLVLTLDRLVEDGEAPGVQWLVAFVLHFLVFGLVGAIDRLAPPERGRLHHVFAPALTRGVLLCALIEVGQLFFASRHAELLDLVMNVFGLASGHLAASTILRSLPAGSAGRHSVLRRAFVVAWGALWLVLSLLPARLVALETWDPAYPLLIGNEQGGDRAWQGELRYVAFYDRALSSDQISGTLGPSPTTAAGSAARLEMGMLAAYDFTRAGRFVIEPEGRLTAPALRLSIPAGSRWAAGEPPALRLGGGPLIATEDAASALTKRIASARAFSVEAWFQPTTLSQTGPARIATISESPWRGNMMLGQEGRALHFRVRNRLTGGSGSEYELVCRDAVLERPLHIVVTYDQGISTMFRDGVKACSAMDLREPSVLLHLGAGPVSAVVTALLAAIERAALVRLLFTGYAWLLVPLAIGPLLRFRPATGLHVWFGPALVLSWFVLTRPSVKMAVQQPSGHDECPVGQVGQ
jgi:hypothetical protein